ncbi:NUDIX hydrolase [Pseudokineococcus sp. 1T1Z-3]|uniref:NUDIX hydrolase n=1 Tax=Pseudokineococcus sp. 1T1Z-3 TaxID=3132745 RepID=UPI00309A6507
MVTSVGLRRLGRGWASGGVGPAGDRARRGGGSVADVRTDRRAGGDGKAEEMQVAGEPGGWPVEVDPSGVTGEVAVPRQRVGAYALCLRGDAVLLSRLAPGTPRPGRWSLPGGGLDHGEDPRDGARREAHEETGLDVVVGPVLQVTSAHFTGRSPAGVLEDFHSIAIVFRGTCEDEREPTVTEVGGTTDAAAWVPLADVASGAVPVTDVVEAALAAARDG